MNGMPRIEKTGFVTKVIKSALPTGDETAEIQLEGADPLYAEIRVSNAFENPGGNKIQLRQGTRVRVTIEVESGQVLTASEEQARAATSS